MITKKRVKRFLLVNLGVIMIALSIHMFLVPSNLAAGGVSGLAIVTSSYVKFLNPGMIMLIFNFILFLLAFIFIGKAFFGYTAYATIALSLMVGFLESTFPNINYFPDEIIMNLIFGILLGSCGMAVLFYQGASSGGTDIIAMIINKYLKIDVGKSLFICDAVVTILATITFTPRIGMYSFLGILMNGILIDKIIAGFNTRVHVYIITAHHERIKDLILNKMNRSGTYLSGKGMYSDLPRDVISLVVTKRQYIEVKNFLAEVDPTAFVIMNYVHDVLGEGFTYENEPR